MKQSTSDSALAILETTLKQRQREFRGKRIRYSVPSSWIPEPGEVRRTNVDPFAFFLDAVKAATRSAPPRHPGKRTTGGEWTGDAVIYNMFVRTTTAFDHNGNGRLDLPANGDGFRETGSFLKAIALLPYIRDLGANTVHLLPITSIGHDGNKGTLGSPYAIRNPYELDENLAEPILGLDARTEFKAFVEAAHRMGLRVVLEFVFRTAAKDADWVKERPEWFYWIREEVPLRDPHHHDEARYGSPLFTRDELDRIHRDVSEHRFDNLLPPHAVYQEMFTPPPGPETIRKEEMKYIGITRDGKRVKIPGAFADWPPDDNQPPWGDVTYLRIYDHPSFNYIAYNTIRMYDARLASNQNINRPLWDKIVGIIPHYQRAFDIDGVMIDMGHALPAGLKEEMVKTARGEDPDFAFWDENFSVTRKSREEGYNAVFGFCWIDEHHPSRMKNMCRRLQSEGFPIPFFATAENHNTPRAAARAGGLVYAQWAWVINNFLPAIPFIHSGFELGEEYPINTGLDFTPEQLKGLPSEKLPLFSEYAYDWLSRKQFTEFIVRVSKIRQKYVSIIVSYDPRSFAVLPDPNERILSFARLGGSPARRLAVVSNTNWEGTEVASVRLDTKLKEVADLLGGTKIGVSDGHLSASLKPGQCLVFEY